MTTTAPAHTRCPSPCPRPPVVPPGTRAVPKTFAQLDIGDRVQTWDGISATVVDVVFHLTVIHDGTLVSFEADVALHSAHLPTFDAFGWPKYYEGTIGRRIHKHSEDLRYHSAGRTEIGAP